MNKKNVNIAVIGCGHWGPTLVRNFIQLSNVNVNYVCDKDNERLRHIGALYPDVKTITDYRTILNSSDLDAVCIATPVNTHFKIAKDALLAGKHVLVEKPMTATSREAKSLIALAAHKGKVLMVAHTLQYNATVEKLRELVKAGELGKLLYISMSRLNLGVFRNDINVVWDLASHDISVLNYLLDRSPESIKAVGSAHYHSKIEDVAFLTLRYPADILAHIHVSWIDPLRVRKVVLVGDKKMAVFDDLNDAEPLKIYDKRVVKQPYHDTYGESKLLYKWGDVFSPRIEGSEPVKTECSHFLECIQRHRKPTSDGESGLRVIQILEAAQKSLKNDGRSVKIH